MTTEEQVQARVRELFESLLHDVLNDANHDNRTWIEERVHRAYNHSAVEPEAFEDNWALPKIIACKIARDIEWQFRPFDADSRALVDRIS